MPLYDVNIFSLLLVLDSIGASEENKAVWKQAFKNLQIVLSAPFVVSDDKMSLTINRDGHMRLKIVFRVSGIPMIFDLFCDMKLVTCLFKSRQNDYRIHLLEMSGNDFTFSHFLNKAVKEDVLTQEQCDEFMSLL